MILNDLPVYDISFDGDEELGMTVISIVDEPAVERNFLKFKEQKKLKFSYNEEQQIIFGPVAIPDRLIYRRDEDGFEYYVKFGKDTIKDMVIKFSKNNLFSQVSFDHNGEIVDNEKITLMSLFLKDTSLGLNPTGYEDLPDGTLFASYKILDSELWNVVKEYENGFSLECICELKPVIEEEDIDGYLQ